MRLILANEVNIGMEGKKAPEFKLADQEGAMVELSDFKGKKVVLYFYVRDFTPGCTNQSCNLRDNQEELKRAGITTLGISPDDVTSHKKFSQKYELSFPLLSDEDAKVAKKYGVFGEKTFMGRNFLGVKRTTFLIDKNGVIVKVMPKVKVKDHANEVISAFKSL